MSGEDKRRLEPHDYGSAGWPLRNRYSEWFAGRFAMLLHARQTTYPNQSHGLGYVNHDTNIARATGPSQAELYVSFMNAMGIPVRTFGVASQCRGPLPGLTG